MGDGRGEEGRAWEDEGLVTRINGCCPIGKVTGCRTKWGQVHVVLGSLREERSSRGRQPLFPLVFLRSGLEKGETANPFPQKGNHHRVMPNLVG